MTWNVDRKKEPAGVLDLGFDQSQGMNLEDMELKEGEIVQISS